MSGANEIIIKSEFKKVSMMQSTLSAIGIQSIFRGVKYCMNTVSYVGFPE